MSTDLYSKPSKLSSLDSSPARGVSSNQLTPHPRLAEVLTRHRNTPFRRPIAAHAVRPLEKLSAALDAHGGPLILDSGCGTGESTFVLAERYPLALVAGIDKSTARLDIAHKRATPRANMIFLRLDLCDLFAHGAAAGWHVERHYLLYPNPWPKQHQLMRRWHAHPVLPSMLELGGEIELRTNWRIYAEEFAFSLDFLSNSPASVQAWTPTHPETAFERKYRASGQPLYRVCASVRRS